MFVTGKRDASHGETRIWAIRNTEEGGADVNLYYSEEERATALAEYRAGKSWRADWRSEFNGGSWQNPIVWDAEPVMPDPDAEFGELVNEMRTMGDVDKTRKLRELVEARRDAERTVTELREAMDAQRDRWTESLRQAQAPISDAADERLAPIWELAAQAADDNGFCPEYEKLCDSLGIPGRPRLRRGVVEVTLNVYAYAMGATEEEAHEAMERQVRERLESEVHTEDRYSNHDDGSISHVDITSVDTSDVEVYN